MFKTEPGPQAAQRIIFLETITVLLKSPRFPWKGSPKEVVENPSPSGDTIGGRVQAFAESTDCFYWIHCGDSARKFKAGHRWQWQVCELWGQTLEKHFHALFHPALDSREVAISGSTDVKN